MSQRAIEESLLGSLGDKYRRIGDRMNLGFYYTPFLINDFLVEFSKRVNPKSILDPVAGLGGSLRMISEALNNKANITSIEINNQTVETAKERSNKFPIKYTLGDAIEILPNIEENFDLIFGDLPWSMRSNKIFFDFKVDGDIVILLKSLEKLKEGGYAIFTNTDSFFVRTYENIKEFINNIGVSLVGSIKLPAGTYYPQTGIQANLIIFQKKTDIENIFLGELNENNYDKLVNNFFDNKGSGDFIGKFLNKNEVKSLLWDKQKSYESIDKLLVQKKIEIMDGCSISTKIDLENTNTVYITTLGFPKIKLGSDFDNDDIQKITEKKARYFQISLSQKYDPKIFSYFYNSSFGKLYFGCLVSGIMNKLSLSKIQETKLYYPTKIYIDKIQQAFDKINSIKNIITDVDSTLKQDFFAINQVYETISKINVMSDIDYIIKDFPTIIAKQYKEYTDTKIKEEYQNALDDINNIFITTSIFCISIMLGGLRRNQEFMNEISDDIVKSVKNFSKLGLGDLYYLYGNISKKIIAKLNDKNGGKEFVMNLFGIEDSMILENIANKKIYDSINEFSILRNKYIGHKGKTDETIYKQILQEAEVLLHQFILGLSCLKDIKVILGSNKVSRIEEYEYLATLTIFNGYLPYSEKLTLSEVPIEGKLYFTIGGNMTIISLPDLIRYDTSTHDQAKIPYIYNRLEKGELEYITYDIAEKERKKYNFADIKDPLLQKLLSKSTKTDD